MRNQRRKTRTSELCPRPNPADCPSPSSVSTAILFSLSLLRFGVFFKRKFILFFVFHQTKFITRSDRSSFVTRKDAKTNTRKKKIKSRKVAPTTRVFATFQISELMLVHGFRGHRRVGEGVSSLRRLTSSLLMPSSSTNTTSIAQGSKIYNRSFGIRNSSMFTRYALNEARAIGTVITKQYFSRSNTNTRRHVRDFHSCAPRVWKTKVCPE